jgi:transmembrane sensor
MNAPNPIAAEILTQAGEWLMELQSSDVSVERINEWQQWLAKSEQHARAFDQLQQTWGIADQLGDCDRDALPWPAHSQLAAPPAQRFRGRLFAAAASALLAVGFGFWLAEGRAGLVYETAVGEQRSVRLTDGSVVSIGPGSRLRVSLKSDARRVDLDQGEAYFQVAKDPLRRFTVRAGSSSVTAIGTAFNVRRNQARVVVGVSEGTVSIAPGEQSLLSRIGLSQTPPLPIASTRLTAGEQLVVEPHPTVEAKVGRIEPPAVASWREGRLHYSGEPLGSIISDINRYVAEPITIADPSIAHLRVTGSVSEANIESWLTSLEASLPVQVVKQGDGRLEIRARQ